MRQFITAMHELAVGLDRRQEVDAILVDFSKDFDNIPHHLLAFKLRHYGIRHKNLSLIQEFLQSFLNRNQQVVLDGKIASADVTGCNP